MEFLGAVIESLFKMAIVATVAIGGVFFGKFLRDRKDKKKSDSQ